jgi:hypothetical protein
VVDSVVLLLDFSVSSQLAKARNRRTEKDSSEMSCPMDFKEFKYKVSNLTNLPNYPGRRPNINWLLFEANPKNSNKLSLEGYQKPQQGRGDGCILS